MAPAATLEVMNATPSDADLLDLLPAVARTGDIASFEYGGEQRILVNDLDEMHRILARGTDEMRITAITDAARLVQGDGLITSSMPRWKPRRIVIQRELTRTAIRPVGAIVDRNTRDRLAGWQAGAELDLKAEMTRLALDNLGDATFGADFGPYAASVGRAVAISQQVLDAANAGRLSENDRQRLSDAVDDLDDLVATLVSTRPDAEGRRRDIVDVLLAAAGTDDEVFADPWVRDEVITLVLAGHDSVAFTTTMALSLLAADPDLWRALQSQVRTALAEGTEPADLPEAAPLSRWVIEETLRLYPPVPVLHRRAPEDYAVGGEPVPAGTILVVSPWVTQRDPRYFADPLTFDPYRFTPERRGVIPRYAYFPFGGGPRVCAGNHFALLESVLVVALTVAETELSLVDGVVPPVVAPVGLTFLAPVRVRVAA